jgi:uncharacterized protein YbjT (DUF2867 family)
MRRARPFDQENDARCHKNRPNEWNVPRGGRRLLSKDFRMLGLAPVHVADIFDERSLVAALEGCDVAVNLATSLPGPSGRGDFAANDHPEAQWHANLGRGL